MLGMQLEGQRHALQHLGDRLHRPHEQGLQLPQSEIACAECSCSPEHRMQLHATARRRYLSSRPTNACTRFRRERRPTRLLLEPRPSILL
jgi:hypothetical protein